MRIESFRRLPSTIINSGQTRTRVIKSPSRVTRSFRYALEKALDDSRDKFKHVQSRGERKSSGQTAQTRARV